MIFYLIGLNVVDFEQIEVGWLDGVKGWCMFWYIIVLQFWFVIFIVFVVIIIGVFWFFDLILIMINGGLFGVSWVFSFYMFEVVLFEYGFCMGYGVVIVVVLFLIMLVFIVYFLWLMYKEEKVC